MIGGCWAGIVAGTPRLKAAIKATTTLFMAGSNDGLRCARRLLRKDMDHKAISDRTRRQHPHASPRQARRASITMIGTAARAATVSTHLICQTALIVRPARVTPARYAHVADCAASAASARLLIASACLLFSRASTGIAISARTVMAIPSRLVSTW